MMKLRNIIGLLGVVGVLSLLAGYFLREATRPVPERENPAQGQRILSSRGEGNVRETGPANQLKKTLARSDGTLHWLHLMAGVEEASLDELAGIALLAKGNEMALQLIAEHWRERDPQHLFDTLVKMSREEEGFPYRELNRHLFDYWLKADLDAAITALSRPDGVPGQHSMRHTISMELMKIDPKRGLEMMKQWGVVSWAPDMRALQHWAGRDPRAAADAVFENATTGVGFQRAAQDVAKVWGKIDPEAALDYMTSKQSHLSQVAQESILKAWALRDFDAASDWLGAQTDSSLQSRLTPRLVEAWAEEDPQAALAWCQDHLKGSILSKSIGLLAKGAAAKDVKSTALLVAGLDSSSGRTQAGVEVARAWFPQSVPSDRKVTPEAVDWLRNLDDPEMQGKILKEISWAWGEHDQEGLMAFLSGPHAVQAPEHVFERMARNLAKDDLDAAFEWAKTLPGERSENVAGQVFRSWLQNQPGSAGKWLEKLPATDDRRPQMVESFIEDTLFRQEEILFQRLGMLKPEDAQAVQTVVERARIPEEKKQRVLDALK